MRTRFLLPALMLYSALGSSVAGEAVAQAEVATFAFPDLARTRTRLQQGPYGRIWAAAGTAQARALLDENLAKLKEDSGADVWALLSDVSEAEFHVMTAESGVGLSESFRLPTQAATAFAAFGRRPGGALDGDTLRFPDRTWKLDGQWVHGHDSAVAAIVRRVDKPAKEQDFVARVDFAALAGESPDALAILGALRFLSAQKLSGNAHF